MSRLPLLSPEDVAEEFRDIISAGLNLHKVMLHSPRTARASRQVGLYLRRDCTLDARLRELAIIQVAFLASSSYEYSHHLKIAEDIEVPPDDLTAISMESRGRTSHLEADARLVLRATREMWSELKIQGPTFEKLRAILTNEHIVDLVFTVSFYCGFVRLTGSLGIEVEPAYLPYLERFPLSKPHHGHPA